MKDNHILQFQQLPQQIRQQIHQDYFFGRKKLNYHDKTFYRYMSQKQSENQDEEFLEKEFNLSCYAPGTLNEIETEPFRLKLSLRNKENYYLIGSLEYLKYSNEQNELKNLQVCDATNKFLCSFHFEIKLPQAMDNLQLQQFQQNFCHYYCGRKLGDALQIQNENYLCLKDISEPNYQTYLLSKQDVKITDTKLFAFHHNTYIRYFFVKDNKENKISYFFDNNNSEQDLTFVVGVKDQQVINEQLFHFFMLDEHEEKTIEEYQNIKTILKAYQKNLQKLTNSIRIKISSFSFDLIVHHNTLNQYALKQGSDSNYNGIFDSMENEIKVYETILQQLSFEEGQWRLKINPKMFDLHQQVEHYQYFYLKKGETALIRCPKANISFSYIDVGQKKSNQQ